MYPLVSVIIPCYNAQRNIEATIKTVLNQSWPNIEIIAIDDGSTDGTLEILQKYEKVNFTIIHQSHMGGSTARNHGLTIAKGNYVQFLDADDLLSQDKIEVQVQMLKNNPGKIAVCPTISFLDGCLPIQVEDNYLSKFLYSTDDPVDFLVNLYGGNGNGGMVSVHSWLTPREVISKAGLWNDSLSVDDDGEYFCRVLLNSRGVCYSSVTNVYYRKYTHGSNLSAQKDFTAFLSIYKSNKLKAKYLLRKIGDERARKAIARLFMEIAVSSYPMYSTISEKALKQVKAMGGIDYVPVIGGKTIENIKNIFGWKTAKLISFTHQNIKKAITKN